MNSFASFFSRQAESGCRQQVAKHFRICELCLLDIPSDEQHYLEFVNVSEAGGHAKARVVCAFCHDLFILPSGSLAPLFSGERNVDDTYADMIRDMQPEEQHAIRKYLTAESFAFLKEFGMRYPRILNALRLGVCQHCDKVTYVKPINQFTVQ